MKSSNAEGEKLIFSEMLPGPRQLWLHDAKGAAYTSELRFAIVDLKARSWSVQGIERYGVWNIGTRPVQRRCGVKFRYIQRGP
jgi:hypothetical protein